MSALQIQHWSHVVRCRKAERRRRTDGILSRHVSHDEAYVSPVHLRTRQHVCDSLRKHWRNWM
jgi:hypothetical protein